MLKSNQKILYLLTLLLSFSAATSSFAEQFDQSYLKWKEKQQAEDSKLKSQSDNYYLSRPSVRSQHVSSTSQSSGKEKSLSSSTEIIHLNSANISELQQLDGVGEKKAAAIIQYRDQNGKFKSIDELQKVKGFGPKMFEKNKKRISL